MTNHNPRPAGRTDDAANRAGAGPTSEPRTGESAREPIITARGVRKSFPLGRSDSIKILHGIDLDIYSGEFVAIVGALRDRKSVV